MKLKTYIATLALIMASVTGYGQETLNSYLETAAQNNPDLKAKFLEYQAALEVVPQVGALPDPQVAFGWFISPVETRYGPQRARFSASQMFPWFGTLEARENVALQSAKAAYEAFEGYKSKLFYQVRSAYYDLYLNGKAIQITEENLDNLRSVNNILDVNIRTGKAPAVDALRIEMELADLNNQLALLKDRFSTQTVKFNNLLNTDNDREIAIPDTLPDENLLLSKTTVFDSIRTNNHELIRFDYQSESLKYRQQAAEKSGSPTFSLGLDYIIIGKPENPMTDVSDNGRDAVIFPKIGISIPLYRKKYEAMVQEAIYKQQSVDAQKTGKENLLQSVFERSWNEYRDAMRRLELYRKQTDFAQRALQLLKTDYSSGKTGFEELLRMDRKVLEYNLELERARADKQAAISFIHYLMGN